MATPERSPIPLPTSSPRGDDKIPRGLQFRRGLSTVNGDNGNVSGRAKGSDAQRACSIYWNFIARTDPGAQALVERLNLRFPKMKTPMEAFFGDIKYPLWRLIITGEDNDDNIELLLGPSWKQGLDHFHQEWRLKVLILPLVERQCLWAGAPQWGPREATAEEKQMLDMHGGQAAEMFKRNKSMSAQMGD